MTVTQLNIHREITGNSCISYGGIAGFRRWMDVARVGSNARTKSERKRKQQKQKGQPHNRKFSKVGKRL